MNLANCPYCEHPGFVTSIKVHGDGLEVSGRCVICGYQCDSDYAPSELTEDLPGDYTVPLDVTAVD